MKILLTSDDGAAAPGTIAMARKLKAMDLDVVIIAPQEDCTGQDEAAITS